MLDETMSSDSALSVDVPADTEMSLSQELMVGTSSHQSRPPIRQAPETTRALKPNMTRGFARIERNAPS